MNINYQIPKIIHLCWFGKGEYHPIIKKCIKSWKNMLPEYEIMVWNEEKFDVTMNAFTKKAYENKKWAFVSDYVRVYVLEKYGGIYMDTDVEVISDFSDLLRENKLIVSCVEGGLIGAGFIASPPHHMFLNELLKYYDNVNSDTDMNIMNPLIFTKVAIQMFNINILKNEFNNNEIHVYPLEYLMPIKKNILLKNEKKYNVSNYYLKKYTFCIHHDLGTWDESCKIKKIIKGIIRIVLPIKIYNYIKKINNRKKLKKMLRN